MPLGEHRSHRRRPWRRDDPADGSRPTALRAGRATLAVRPALHLPRWTSVRSSIRTSACCEHPSWVLGLCLDTIGPR